MKRGFIVIAALALALSGCSKGVKIGGEDVCGPKGCLASVPASKSPTPKRTATPSKSPTARPTVATPPAAKGNTFTIVVKDVNNGYSPNTLRAKVGDTVIFKNLDMNTPAGHSFTGDNNEWNSGLKKPGESWTWKINIAPGYYHWHDENVPYLVGGPLQVLP